jgi:hypothetical protein
MPGVSKGKFCRIAEIPKAGWSGSEAAVFHCRVSVTASGCFSFEEEGFE